MISKKRLAITLSKLEQFSSPDVRLEQYPTDSEIAAEVLWNAYMQKDIEGKTIVDMGCGTGILGLGCLLLGAKSVAFIDIDDKALEICKNNIEENFEGNNYTILKADVKDIQIAADIVVMNPPFGSKNKHADKVFLERAFSVPTIYSFHIAETRAYIEALAKKNNFEVTHYWEYSFPLKNTMKFHSKKIQHIAVGVFRFEKKS